MGQTAKASSRGCVAPGQCGQTLVTLDDGPLTTVTTGPRSLIIRGLDPDQGEVEVLVTLRLVTLLTWIPRGHEHWGQSEAPKVPHRGWFYFWRVFQFRAENNNDDEWI